MGKETYFWKAVQEKSIDHQEVLIGEKLVTGIFYTAVKLFRRVAINVKQFRSFSVKNLLKHASLKVKWMLSTFLFVLSFSIILVTFFITSGKRDLEKELERWVTSLATNLARGARFAVLAKDHKTLQDYLVGIMIQKEVLYAAILDVDGAILGLEDPRWMFNTKIHDFSAQIGNNNITKFLKADGKYYYNILKYIEIENKYLSSDFNLIPIQPQAKFSPSSEFVPDKLESKTRIGKVILGISLDRMNVKIINLRNKAIYITVVVGLIVQFFVLLGVNRMSAPIKQLAVATCKITDGDLNHLIKNNRSDELGLLADSFNKMVLRLKDSSEEKKSYTQLLEQQVQSRTLELSESEKKYRTLFEHVGSAVALIDESGKLAMVNKEFEALSGYTKPEVENKLKFIHFLADDCRNKFAMLIQGRYQNNSVTGPVNDECSFNDRFGNHKNVNLTLTRMPNTKMLLASLVNVSELRELHKRLNRSEQLATIGELSAAIAHEIRNSLVAINTSVGVLRNQVSSGADDQELLGIICEESERLNRIIDDFLRFARPNKPRFRDTDINKLVQETLILLRDRIGKQIHQQVTLQADLPKVAVDAGQIKQVIINIVLNAVEAMLSGGVLKIATRLSESKTGPQSIEIVVIDSGMGIKKTEFRKIFQPFYSTKEQGAGMGLAICERIIQNHEGEIKVESSIGKGTEMVVQLPMRQVKTEA